MEGVSTTVYKGLKSYWRRRGYKKLNGPDRRRTSGAELGSTSTSTTKRRRLWRIKIKRPKLKIFLTRMSSPKKLFMWLRDAYVNMMMGFANSQVCYAGDGITGFGRRQLKEYDEKMIIEIYKSLVMSQGQLVPRDGSSSHSLPKINEHVSYLTV